MFRIQNSKYCTVVCKCLWMAAGLTSSVQLRIGTKRSETSCFSLNSLEKMYFLDVFDSCSPFLCQKSESLLSLFAQLLLIKDQQDRFALVALYKRAKMRELLLSLFTKERPWVNWSRRSLKRVTGAICTFSRANRSFALMITKNEQFAQKTDDRIPNPA